LSLFFYVKKFGITGVSFKKTGVVLLLISYTFTLTVNQSKEDLQVQGSGESYAAAQAVAVISNVNPLAEMVAQSLRNRKELRCLGKFEERSPVIITETLKFKCFNSEAWLTNEFQKWYLQFVLTHPKYSLKLISISLTIGNSPYSMYGGSLSIVPAPISNIFFGERNYAIRMNNDSADSVPIDKLSASSPLLFWIVLFVLTYATRKNITVRAKVSTFESKSENLVFAIFIFGAMAIIASAISIPNEWFRQSIVGQVAILVAGVISTGRYIEYSLRRLHEIR
jgi:hypothetical protein